jgi:hypothetical protein
MEQLPVDRPSASTEERHEVRRRSERAMAEARALIERCVALQDETERQRLRFEANTAALAELRSGMRGLVVDYSRTLRELDVAPENAVILVKQLLDDPWRRLPADVMVKLRQDVVTWAVEAYFGA